MRVTTLLNFSFEDDFQSAHITVKAYQSESGTVRHIVSYHSTLNDRPHTTEQYAMLDEAMLAGRTVGRTIRDTVARYLS